MQAARSLAAVVLFLAAPAAAQKIDLSGLLGGPSPAGPSAGESAGPEKEIVLAAIREYTGPGSATALKTFAPMFGTRSKPDGTSEAFGEKHLQEAGKMLESLIRSGKIVVKPVQGGGVAGAWAPDIIDGKMTGGTFEVGDPKPVKKIGSNSRTYSDLFKQDVFVGLPS